MKRIVSLGLVVGGLAGLFWVYSLAQTAGPQNIVSKLERAKALLHAGKPDEARAVLVTITAGEPDFEPAKFYEAFARSEANDRLGFLNALEKLAPQSNNIPSELEMELTVRQIEALSFYRKFEELVAQGAGVSGATRGLTGCSGDAGTFAGRVVRAGPEENL